MPAPAPPPIAAASPPPPENSIVYDWLIFDLWGIQTVYPTLDALHKFSFWWANYLPHLIYLALLLVKVQLIWNGWRNEWTNQWTARSTPDSTASSLRSPIPSDLGSVEGRSARNITVEIIALHSSHSFATQASKRACEMKRLQLKSIFLAVLPENTIIISKKRSRCQTKSQLFRLCFTCTSNCEYFSRNGKFLM